MPIIDDDLAAPPQPAPAVVRIAEPQFKGVTVDTRYEPVASLLSNVQGSAWTANYFSQILAADSQLSGQQPSLDPLYQQYRLIKDFELKVTSPLSTSQDETTKVMKTTGGANVYPFLIPNVGDMFVADVGDGREGIFRVTASERRSIFKDTCYAIEYELVSFADPTRTADLYSKVQQTLQFVRDFLQHGQNPLLEEAEFVLVQQLAERYHELVQLYFRAMYSNEYKTLCVPSQDYPTYDPFLTAAVLKWFSSWDALEIRKVRQLNTDGDAALQSYTLWDALNERNPRHLKLAATKCGLLSAKMFQHDPMQESIYWSGIRLLVYPQDPTVSVNTEQSGVHKNFELDVLKAESSSAPADGDPAIPRPPTIWPVLKDDFYVFSQAFYSQDMANQSRLELAVWDYLQGKALDRALLLKLCDSYYDWGPLERFYYVPIVAMLIKASIRYL